MNTDGLLHATALPGPLLSRLAATVGDCARRLRGRFQAWRTARAAHRRTVQIEHDLANLSLHMLKDIGAPPGLIERRRAQEAFEAELRALGLRLHG